MPVFHTISDLVALSEVTKNGKTYLIVSDYRGETFRSRSDMQEIIRELQKTVRAISDAEIQDLNERTCLKYSPHMFPQIYGEDHPKWRVYLHEQYILSLQKSSHPIEPPPKKRHEGFVYIAQCQQYYKIGCSKNPPVRILAFNVKAPFPVNLLFTIATSDMYAMEQHLHRRFASKCAEGEWFLLTEIDLEDIKNDFVYKEPTS